MVSCTRTARSARSSTRAKYRASTGECSGRVAAERVVALSEARRTSAEEDRIGRSGQSGKFRAPIAHGMDEQKASPNAPLLGERARWSDLVRLGPRPHRDVAFGAEARHVGITPVVPAGGRIEANRTQVLSECGEASCWRRWSPARHSRRRHGRRRFGWWRPCCSKRW